MKVWITSDGTVPGTKVFDERGQRFDSIVRITWEIDAEAGGIARAELQVRPVGVNILGAEADLICASCGRSIDEPPKGDTDEDAHDEELQVYGRSDPIRLHSQPDDAEPGEALPEGVSSTRDTGNAGP